MQIRFQSQNLFSLHWWFMLLATLCVASLTTRLGYWQLGRAEFKEAAHQLEISQAKRPPLSTQELLQSSLHENHLQRRIDLEGRWLNEWTIYLENRSMNGKPGFWVFTPLELSPSKVLMVQRGWAPRDLINAHQLPVIDTPQGIVRIQGRLVAPPSTMFELSAQSEITPRGINVIRQNLDMSAFAHEIGLPLFANALQTDATSDGLLREWPTILSGADKNRAYALQWFALAVLCIGLFTWFQIIQKIRHA